MRFRVVILVGEEAFHLGGEAHESRLHFGGLLLDVDFFDTLGYFGTRALRDVRDGLAKVLSATFKICFLELLLHSGALAAEERAYLVDSVRFSLAAQAGNLRVALELLFFRCMMHAADDVDVARGALDCGGTFVDEKPVTFNVSIEQDQTLLLRRYLRLRHQPVLHLVELVAPVLAPHGAVLTFERAIWLSEAEPIHECVELQIARASLQNTNLLLSPLVEVDRPDEGDRRRK